MIDIETDSKCEVGSANVAEPRRPSKSSREHFVKLGKRVARRLFRLSGEFVAIVLGVGFLWFAGINMLLAQRTVNVTFLKDNAELWFAQAYDGQDASIGQIQIEWLGASNIIQFKVRDIVVTDKQGSEIQRINAFSGEIGIESALTGEPCRRWRRSDIF